MLGEVNVVDLEMVALEAIFRRSDVTVEIGEEDAGLNSGGGIVEPLEQRSEGGVSSIAGLLALLEEFFDHSS